MNWSRSSKILLVLLLVAVAAVGSATAVSVSGDAPSTVQVGKQQTTTFTFDQPFAEYEQWTLSGSTQLEDVNWQVITYDNANNQVNEKTFTGQHFAYPLDAKKGVVKVEVKLVGTTPTPSNWSYAPAQQINYATFTQSQQGGASDVLSTASARPYTTQSQQARSAIDDAKSSIDDAQNAGIDVTQATNDLDNAIAFYDNGNFAQSEKNANNAASEAQNAMQSHNQTNLLLMIGGGIVVLAVVVGGVYWYLQSRETYDRLG